MKPFRFGERSIPMAHRCRPRIRIPQRSVDDLTMRVDVRMSGRRVTALVLAAVTTSCGAKTPLLVADRVAPIDAACTFAPARGDVTGTLRSFASGAELPAGRYRVRYIDGCMKYAPGQGWTVNAYAPDAGVDRWHLVASGSRPIDLVLPGHVGFVLGAGGFADFDDCVASSLREPPIEFDFAGGVLGVRLTDSPYSDNVDGIDGRSPTWAIECIAH
jgi:hypothetical protein